MKKDDNVHTAKAVGETAAAGVQIGVRRTLPISAEQAWNYLISPEGAKLWLGSTEQLVFAAGERFFSSEGLGGQFKVVKPQQQLRLRWQKPGWAKPSTLQIRLLPAKTGTTISFHQEQLADLSTREEMKVHWESVLEEIRERMQQI